MIKQAQPYIQSRKVLPTMETLGGLIRRRMKAPDVNIRSNAELARAIGVSAAYAGDLINDTGKTRNGTYRPGPEVIAKLTEALKVSQSEILATLYESGVDTLIKDTYGLYRGLDRVKEEKRDAVAAKMKDLIELMAEDEDHDTDYIDD